MDTGQPWGSAGAVSMLQPVMYPKLQGPSVEQLPEFLQKYEE